MEEDNYNCHREDNIVHYLSDSPHGDDHVSVLLKVLLNDRVDGRHNDHHDDFDGHHIDDHYNQLSTSAHTRGNVVNDHLLWIKKSANTEFQIHLLA